MRQTCRRTALIMVLPLYCLDFPTPFLYTDSHRSSSFIQTEKMLCPYCGKNVEEGAAFCTYCGASIGSPTQESSPFEQRETPFTQYPPTQSSGGNAVASLTLGIISWITCGGLFILPAIGLILGIFGLKSVKKNMATTGVVLNATALMLIFFAGIPIALLLPAVQAAREAARRMQCSNHEKQIGRALHDYHDANGALPPLYTVDDEGNPLHSWRVLILPYIEHRSLHDQIRLDEPWDSEYNRQFHDQMPRIFKCPSNPQPGCCYSAIAGGAFIPAEEAGSVTGLKLSDITSGISNTLAVVEVRDAFCWMAPTADISLEKFVQGTGAGSYHTGGFNATLLDGSVRFIRTNEIAPETLRAMATPKK